MNWTIYFGLIIAVLLAITGVLVHNAFWSLPREARRRLKESLRAVSYAVECRANHRLGRSEDVASLALAIAEKLKLGRRHQLRIEMAAYLRDLGLTSIPYSIINKRPEERTEEEQALYATHTERSAGMLSLVPSLRVVAPIVRELDAWWDGSSGNHLPKATEISFEARVLAAAAEFVETLALYGHERAIERLVEHRGTRFDPLVVDALLEVEASLINERPKEHAHTLAS